MAKGVLPKMKQITVEKQNTVYLMCLRIKKFSMKVFSISYKCVLMATVLFNHTLLTCWWVYLLLLSLGLLC